jgi:hypothetical protein
MNWKLNSIVLAKSTDSNMVKGEELRQRLLSSNIFYQSDVAMIIQDMLKAGYLEEVSFDTYRKKKRWSSEGYDEEGHNSKKEREVVWGYFFLTPYGQ